MISSAAIDLLLNDRNSFPSAQPTPLPTQVTLWPSTPSDTAAAPTLAENSVSIKAYASTARNQATTKAAAQKRSATTRALLTSPLTPPVSLRPSRTTLPVSLHPSRTTPPVSPHPSRTTPPVSLHPSRTTPPVGPRLNRMAPSISPHPDHTARHSTSSAPLEALLKAKLRAIFP